MTPEARLRGFLAPFTPVITARVRAVRAALQKRLPGALEMVYDNYNFLVIGFGPSERPSDAILSIAASARGVMLCFLQSAGQLPDPDALLRGGGAMARHVVIEEAGMLNRPAVRKLISEALSRARVPLDPKQPRRLLIKSVSPNRRPRQAGGRAVKAASAAHTVTEHLKGRAPVVTQLYRKLLTAARSLGPVREDPKKSSIHLVRTTGFAGITPRKDSLILTLKSAADVVSPRIRKRHRASAHRWYLEIRLDAVGQVDAELKRWLERSYDLS